jgi:hypothetical protein
MSWGPLFGPTAWEKALNVFIACLRSGRFEPSLRVKRVQGYPGVWEMTVGD